MLSSRSDRAGVAVLSGQPTSRTGASNGQPAEESAHTGRHRIDIDADY